MKNIDYELIKQAELNILSIMVRFKTASFDVLSKLKEDDFSIIAHKMIFKNISELLLKNQSITLTTLANKMNESKELSSSGGVEYLTEIFGSFVSDEELDDYLEIIIENVNSNSLVSIANNIIKKVNDNEKIESIIEFSEKSILNINSSRLDRTFVNASKEIDNVILKIEDLASNESNLTGIASGFFELDKMTAGFQKGDFIILAARPSMGKTALALNMAFNAWRENRKAVCLFSLEMPTQQILLRLLTSLSVNVDSQKLRTGKGITSEEWSKITRASEQIKNMNFFIDDTPGLSVVKLQSKLRKFSKEQEIGIVFIDYLQLLTPTSKESRQQEVSDISRQLKAIAREIDVPIICLSQLSRAVEKREDKRPVMSDLRDSGAIEQDADLIMFLYREDYYQLDPETEVGGPNAQLIVSKHRNGPIGDVSLIFSKKQGSFENYS
ncbi:replicative DNA helicase [Spiroplasma endosymbiont of Amphibalanus improvisus]|uniref:replicative DNA helicase n=1 Tax=Spiroplasma endosymbiont of Amphibalanus improvisus TaxID=3066327 RepID=UPI00313D658C